MFRSSHARPHGAARARIVDRRRGWRDRPWLPLSLSMWTGPSRTRRSVTVARRPCRGGSLAREPEILGLDPLLHVVRHPLELARTPLDRLLDRLGLEDESLGHLGLR